MSDKFCIGCGVKLQEENMAQDGYTTSLENDICLRCFRMKNYGEYQIVAKSNEEYIKILKQISSTGDLVLYVIDCLNIDENILKIRDYITNPMIVVLNKRDVLPKSIKDVKLLGYLKKMGFSSEKMIVISCEKNYHLDELMALINKCKKSDEVYVVGNTNVGKSSLINKLMKNYSVYPSSLTISPMPSTTLDKVSVKLKDDLTIIDTPGLIDRGNITNYVDSSLIKMINPKKEIKPKTYQIRSGQCLVIGNVMRIDYLEGDKNSFTIFVSNDLKIKRYNASKCELLKDTSKSTYDVSFHQDLVVDGLGFIKIVAPAKVDVYIDMNVNVFIRDSLI